MGRFFLLLLSPNRFGSVGRTWLGAVSPMDWPGSELILPGWEHCCPQTLGSPTPAAGKLLRCQRGKPVTR